MTVTEIAALAGIATSAGAVVWAAASNVASNKAVVEHLKDTVEVFRETLIDHGERIARLEGRR